MRSIGRVRSVCKIKYSCYSSEIRVQKNSWSKDLVVKKSVRSVRSVCVYKKDPRAK